MHDNIKKFFLEGVVGDDENLVVAKGWLVKNLEDQMRDNGFVPVLDMDEQFTLDFDEERESYDFVLTLYGVKVGIQQSWQIAGILNGKAIKKTTALIK